MRDFPIAVIADAGQIAVDLDRLVQTAVSRSQHQEPSESPQLLARLVTEALSSAADPRRLCSGHDLASALSYLVRTAWGGRAGAEQVLRAIRSAFSCAELMSTGLYRRVQMWASRKQTIVWSCPSV
jgi:hypothetical protein